MRLREGASTMGLWLPLAFAELIQVIIGMFGNAPKKSEILEHFALPELAKAMKRDEEGARLDGLTSWIVGMKERFGNGRKH